MPNVSDIDIAEISIDDHEMLFDIDTRNRKRHVALHFQNEKPVWSNFVSSLESGDVVWDVGANYGIYSIPAAKFLRDDDVYAFEPNPNVRTVLQRNCQINGEEIDVFDLALSDDEGEVEMNMRKDEDGTSVLDGDGSDDYESYEKTITVQQERGETLVRNSVVPQPDVVKIDVEGAEGLVLGGLGDVLDDVKLLYLEMHKPNEMAPSVEDFGHSISGMQTTLRDRGYELTTLTEGPNNMVVKATNSSR